MRQYQPIWNQIKKYKKATIVAPSFSHSKIIQAVMKERSADIPYRNLLKRKDMRMELIKAIDKEKDTITFTFLEVNRIKLSDL